MVLEDILHKVYRRLVPTSETPSLDAQVLLAHVMGRSRPWVLAHPEATLLPEQVHDLEQAVARLEDGEPLPYVLGHWEFYGLDFAITPAVLIPRPETELLVEQALAWLRNHPGQRLAADVGTGSGCIAISLAKYHPEVLVLACDLSFEALRVASLNASRHGVTGQVGFVQANLLPATGRLYDLICANLPYIPAETLRALRVYRWEPELALDGGKSGLDLVRGLLVGASHRLTPGGLLLAEIEASQGVKARSLACRAFPQAEVQVLPDLAGHDRLLVVRQPEIKIGSN